MPALSRHFCHVPTRSATLARTLIGEAARGGLALNLAEVEPLPLDVGQVLGGKYELLRWLASGAMGEVWVARHRSLDEPVAIKVLLPSYDPDEWSSLARFRLEARIAARLSTKTAHVVRVTDYGDHGSRPYLVMELLEGETLENEILRGVLQPRRVAEIVSQIARGLGVAHAEGVLHRDLKPANVFLGRDEHGALLVKLLDFGIARAPRDGKLASSPMVTAQGLALGTPAYMSPEQVVEPSLVDLQCDLWALAATAFEALTGQVPTQGRDARDVFLNLLGGHLFSIRAYPGLPRALGPFFDRAFARNAQDRFESAAAMATAFQLAIEPDRRPAPTVRLAAVKEKVDLRGPRPLPDTVALVPVGTQHRSRGARRALALCCSIAIMAVVGMVSSSWQANATSSVVMTGGHRTVATHAQRTSVETWLDAPAPPAPVLPPQPPPPSAQPTAPPPRVIDRSALL
jgi:serine/threonine protein kinase